MSHPTCYNYGMKENNMKKTNIGFTSIEEDSNTLEISHAGNMSNTVKGSVDPNLKIAGIPSVKQLKKKFPKFIEEGSPSYMWSIRFEKV